MSSWSCSGSERGTAGSRALLPRDASMKGNLVSTDRNLLADRLKDALEKRAMTFAEFSKRTGLSPQRFRAWRRANTSPAEKMAMFLVDAIERIKQGRPLGKVHRNRSRRDKK